MIQYIQVAADSEVELAAAQFIMQAVMIPYFQTSEFQKLCQYFGGQSWTNKLEKSNEPLKKTQPKKKKSLPTSKKPTKPAIKRATSAKKSSKKNLKDKKWVVLSGTSSKEKRR